MPRRRHTGRPGGYRSGPNLNILCRPTRARTCWWQLELFPWNHDPIIPRDEWKVKTRKALLRKINPAERHVRKLLRSISAVYFRERPIEVDDRLFFVDFHVTSIKEGCGPRKRLMIALEIDGGYHYSPEQQAKDARKDAYLLRSAEVWRVVRIKAQIAATLEGEQLRRMLCEAGIGGITMYEREPVLACTSAGCCYPQCFCHDQLG